MAGYPKIWTSIFNDRWFLGLPLSERGLWLQLIVYAKLVGDTGRIEGRSWAAMGAVWGCDGKTCRKILGNFRIAGKIDLEISPHGRREQVSITILKYGQYQSLTAKTAQVYVAENSPQSKSRNEENSPLTRPEKSKPDQTRPEKSKDRTSAKADSPHRAASDFWVKEYKDKIGIEYRFQKKDGVALAALLKVVDLDEFKRLATWIIKTEEKWYCDNRTPAILNSKLNEIRIIAEKRPNGYEIPRVPI